MKIRFQRCNPYNGGESFLIRFGTEGSGDSCVLVDAGEGVSVDARLRKSDSLEAILLTHAHQDHYIELGETHRSGVPIFTSQATAALLDDVFEMAQRAGTTTPGEEGQNAITDISEWTELFQDVYVHPISVGHTPGAAGFLIRVEDGDSVRRMFVTGDFTCRDAGGFQGLDPDELPVIDALFLTHSTATDFEANLTEGVGSALKHAHAGAPTLVTTNGLAGVQLGAVLGTISSQEELGVPVQLVGQVAKLYNALNYDTDLVTPIEEFQNPHRVVVPGCITVAGPSVPQEGSAGRLFDSLREDPQAYVIQFTDGGDPVKKAQCTIHDYRLTNHPMFETVKSVQQTIDPVHTVVTHSHRQPPERFKSLSGCVWTVDDTDSYTLHDGDGWVNPPWMGGEYALQPSGMSLLSGQIGAERATIPTNASPPSVLPESEGVDLDRLSGILCR